MHWVYLRWQWLAFYDHWYSWAPKLPCSGTFEGILSVEYSFSLHCWIKEYLLFFSFEAGSHCVT
jgi:hypothetical protein